MKARAKQNSLDKFKSFVKGEITADQFFSKVRFLFRGDPTDEPMLEADEYLKQFAPRKEAKKQDRKSKKKQPGVEKIQPPENARPTTRPMAEIHISDTGVFTFSTNPDAYSDLKQQLENHVRVNL